MICIVDDDESVRTALVRLLKSVGLDSCSFASGEAFLSADVVRDTALLIIDVRMKGVSGLDVQTALLRQGVQIPTVFVSAHADAVLRDAALAAGAIGFLSKPFSADALLAYVLAHVSASPGGAVSPRPD
ncbi:response regulator [Pigmentiphaga aceris]|uniref:Response regulator n=1 Tax=Pigmentiphaga aceris TaxID=1940612 RepID=A0A5C0AS02_9BURK|nr:response regulator [Pigmentiphaga aceris]QEI04775.1 response regulator [Pigmentiphaga aceris]